MPPGLRAISFAFVLVAATGCASKSAVESEPHKGTGTASMVAGIQQITVHTGDNYRFDPSTIVVRPGKVRVVLINDGKGAPHNWSLLGFPGAFVPLAAKGATTSVTFTAPAPGTYQFVCTIHRNQGQTGKLVVLAR